MRIRLSKPAEADVESTLLTSEARWGPHRRRRYELLFALAMGRIGASPTGRNTVDRSDVRPGLRSLHVRHVRAASKTDAVRHPVHVVYYRIVEPDLIEIVSVLHERMEPELHIDR